MGKRNRERKERIRVGIESSFAWEREDTEAMLSGHRAYLRQSERFSALTKQNPPLAQLVYAGHLSLNEAYQRPNSE
jgi:hypothetical protein